MASDVEETNGAVHMVVGQCFECFGGGGKGM